MSSPKSLTLTLSRSKAIGSNRPSSFRLECTEFESRCTPSSLWSDLSLSAPLGAFKSSAVDSAQLRSSFDAAPKVDELLVSAKASPTANDATNAPSAAQNAATPNAAPLPPIGRPATIAPPTSFEALPSAIHQADIDLLNASLQVKAGSCSCGS